MKSFLKHQEVRADDMVLQAYILQRHDITELNRAVAGCGNYTVIPEYAVKMSILTGNLVNTDGLKARVRKDLKKKSGRKEPRKGDIDDEFPINVSVNGSDSAMSQISEKSHNLHKRHLKEAGKKSLSLKKMPPL